MSDAVVLPEVYAKEWVKQLQQEVAQQRQLLQQGHQITDALLARDMQAFQVAVCAQAATLRDGEQMYRRRVALRRAAAKHCDCDDAEMRLQRIIDMCEEGVQEEMRTMREDLNTLLMEVRHVTDRNAMLIRTSLGLVQDIIDVVAGPRVGDGYDRQGRDNDRHSQSGSLVDLAG